MLRLPPISTLSLHDALPIYTIPELIVGSYEVEAQLPGFQTELRSGITLSVGRNAVINFALTVGQLSDKDTITDRKSTRLNSSHSSISYAVFCLKKKKKNKK